MPRVAELINQYSSNDRVARQRAANPTSTVARLVSSYEETAFDDADGLQVDGSVETSSIGSDHEPERNRLADVPSPVDSFYQYPKVNKPSLYAAASGPPPAPTPLPYSQQRHRRNPQLPPNPPRRVAEGDANTRRPSTPRSARDSREEAIQAEQRAEEEEQRRSRSGGPGGAYVQREPSNSSTIRSNRSNGSSSSSSPISPVGGLGEEDDLQPSLSGNGRIPSNLRANPLPKAKVVIARRRPQSQSVDLGLPSFEDAHSVGPLRDPVSAPVLPVAPKFAAGRVSLVNLMETNTETIVPDMGDPDFDDLDDDDFDRVADGADRPHLIDPMADPYTSPEELSGGRGAGFGESAPVTNKKPARKGLFGKKGGKDKNHNESRFDSDVQRRATMVSGAIDRLSVRVDPYVDFLANGTGAPASRPVKKNRFSKMMKRLFGQGDRKLIKR